MTENTDSNERGPSRSDLVSDLTTVTEELGRIPKLTEMREFGEFSDRQYFAEFGDWDAALEAAGLDIRTQLVETVRAAAADCDGPVTKSEVVEFGPYQPNWYSEHFESWEEALIEAGIEPATEEAVLAETARIAEAIDGTPSSKTFTRRSSLGRRDYQAHFESWEAVLETADLVPTKDDILQEIRRLTEELGRIPRASDFAEHGRYRSRDYQRQFDRWENALKAAGVLPTEREVLEEIQRVTKGSDSIPTAAAFLEQSRIRRDDYTRHFGSWNDALDAAGLLPDKEAVIDEIQALQAALDTIPTATEFRDQSRYRQSDYLRHFESWDDAIEAAGLLPTRREIIEEIQRLRTDLERVPTEQDFAEFGAFRVEDCKQVFADWESALEAANVLPDELEIVDTVRQLKRDCGRIPTADEFRTQTPFRRKDYRRYFSSWEAVLDRAGLLPDRDAVVDAIRDLISKAEEAPTQTMFDSETEFRKADYRRHFGGWSNAVDAAIAEADTPGELLREYVGSGELDKVTKLAEQLGHPPTEKYARNHDGVDVDAVMEPISEWDTALEATGFDPAETDRTKELAREIETLAEQLDHRPNEREVIEYLLDDEEWKDRRRIDRALDEADIPDERDLTPTRSLTRQRNTQFEDTIPTHTDLLAELNVVRARGRHETLVEDYRERGVIDERHFETQFGSLSKAIAQLQSLDTRAFREPRKRARTTPGPVLTESVEELAEILDRRPLLEEVVFLSDAHVADFADAFESWEAVSEAVTPIESWSNETLLTDIERVGRELGKPPSLSEIAEFGTYPAPCYLRRFGSWPRALSLVGVEVASIPEEYLEFERTAQVWDITAQLLREGFAQQDALLDELHRLAFEFGGRPSEAIVSDFSPYTVDLYQEAFGSVTTGIEATRFEMPETADSDVPTSKALQSELNGVAQSTTRWILPQDVCNESHYLPGTYIGVFRSLEAALTAADLSTAHLAGPTDTYSDIWHSDHQVKAGLLRTIYQLTQDRGEPPTMARITSMDGVSQPLIYRFFDSWDDALAAADVIASTENPSRVDIEHEDVENPDFVDDLLTEMSETMGTEDR